MSGGEVVGEESLFGELSARVRDVRTGPDGALYILTLDSVVRVTPSAPPP
jgi:glucose/arabinose dehydrogenase